MKKFYTLIAFTMMAMAASAAVEVTCNGAAVTDGQTVTLGKSDFTSINGIGYAIEARLTVTGSTPVKIEGVSDSNILAVCLDAGGNCFNYTQDGNLYKISDQLTDSPSNLVVDKAYIPAAEVPEVKTYIDLTFTEADNSKVAFKLVVDTTEGAGIDAVSANKPVVKVQGNTLVYDVPTATQLAVYSIAGNMVVNANVNGNGTLDLSHLNPGLYICRAGHTTGKLIKK